MRTGILPLARATFDVAYAEERFAAMRSALARAGAEIVGSPALLFDAEAADAAMAELAGAAIDRLLILQITFTDAATTLAAASRLDAPLSLWAVPEPRLGGRLRLNAFCGLNLASHALGRAGRDFAYLYAAPDAPGIDEDLAALLAGDRNAGTLDAHLADTNRSEAGDAIAASLRQARIGRIGEHPTGFDTCRYDPQALRALAGVEVDEIALDALFEGARAVAADEVVATRRAAARDLDGLDAVDQAELDRSLRLKTAIETLRAGGAYDAFAIRCWPETFTEYGGAVCGPVSMMGEARVPCACEADVYGALTSLTLQRVADQPVFLVDLVDLDADDDTGVVWHCGQAPVSMAAPATPPHATIHTNRKMPLLYEFALKPGRVTFARISQAAGAPRLVLAGGEMLDRPMAFTGTSGVVRFDRPASEILANVMDSRLEHHMALAYGEHRPALEAVAAALGIGVIDLSSGR